MRAARSRLVVNSVSLSSFAEGRMKLFGAEIFNNFSVAVVVPEPGWKQRIRGNVQATASGNMQVFAHFSSKISTFWLLFS